MNREEAIDVLSDFRKFTLSILGKSIYADRCSALDMAIEALQGGDADMTGTSPYMQQSRHDDGRPSGEWKYLYGSIGSYMTISCPICGSTFNDVAEWKYNFCPNCGADMRKGEK